MQARNLDSRHWGTAGLENRTALILDIFAAELPAAGQTAVDQPSAYWLPQLGRAGQFFPCLDWAAAPISAPATLQQLFRRRRDITHWITVTQQRELKAVQERRERMHLRRHKEPGAADGSNAGELLNARIRICPNEYVNGRGQTCRLDQLLPLCGPHRPAAGATSAAIK